MSGATDLADCLVRAYDGTRDPAKRDEFHAVTTSDRSQYLVTEMRDGWAVAWVMYQGELYQVRTARQADQGGENRERQDRRSDSSEAAARR